MLNNDSPYHQTFHSLLDRLRDEVNAYREQIRELKRENEQLTSKLEEIQDGQTDIFSAMTESERLAMRQKITGLISKIDTHLEDEQP